MRVPGYKGAEPPAWMLPGLSPIGDTGGGVGAEASPNPGGPPPELFANRPSVLQRDRFTALASKARALKHGARTERERELASKLLAACRLGIGGQSEEADAAMAEAMKRYEEAS